MDSSNWSSSPRATGRLGVRILGDHATELVHVGQAVLNYGGPIGYFIHSTFNSPTESET